MGEPASKRWSRLRVVALEQHLPELTTQLRQGRLRLPDHDHIEVVTIDRCREPGAHLDLLYVPHDTPLSPDVGRQFGATTAAIRAGTVNPTDGTIVHQGDPRQLVTFFQSRGDQADQSVYDTGPTTRTAFASAPIAGTLNPRQLYLGLTQKCDHDCDFCVSRTFDFDLLSMQEIDQLIDELRGDLDVIALTGAGEAMVHPEFWAMFDRLQKGFPSATFKMNTSGLSLARYSDRLLDYPIKNITISLNAATDETYRLHIGQGRRAVLRGIETLVGARHRRQAYDVRLCLSAVLMRSTVPELPAMVRLAFELGVEEIQGIYLMIHSPELASESTWHDQETSNHWLDAAADMSARLGVTTSLPARYGSSAAVHDHQHASLPTSHGHLCTEVFTTAYVRPNGDLTPCPYYDSTLGNTRTDGGFTQVWNGLGYQQLRHTIVSGDLPNPCRSCAGFSEGGRVDDYASHWLGERGDSGHQVPVQLRSR